MRRTLLFILLMLLLISCAPLSSVQDKAELLAYFPQTHDTEELISRYRPIFLVERHEKEYNRIGTPKAELTDIGNEKIYVDFRDATIYFDKRYFQTSNNSYTNLIYRVHFSKTPYGLFPFQLGAGNNVGLIVIVTLNKSNLPVLYTTVHTCGCFLAFIPTTHLLRKSFPRDWPKEKQVVFSEVLPSLLDMKTNQDQSTYLMILLRDASHRIRDIWLEEKTSLSNYKIKTAHLKPLYTLEKLQLNETSDTTSFYEISGKQTGFVKNNNKPFERLLMSWWTFDWHIGEDKKLGRDKNDPPVFYTSLKPWARAASDMRDFATFLKYWGWNL